MRPSSGLMQGMVAKAEDAVRSRMASAATVDRMVIPPLPDATLLTFADHSTENRISLQYGGVAHR